MTQVNKKNNEWPERLIKLTTSVFRNFFHATREVYLGLKNRIIPIDLFSIWSLLFAAFIYTHLDYRLFEKLHLEKLYPFKPALYWSYVAFWVVLFPYVVWGFIQVKRLQYLLKALTEVFQCAGLKTTTGRLPGFVSDSPIDSGLRELKIYMNGIPKSSFEKAKDQIGTSLHGFVDEIRENRLKGELSIRYARWNFPEHTTIKNPRGTFPNTFVVGDTRTERLEVSLVDVPHLLVGGASNSGKSTFLKQMVLVLYINNPSMRFEFLDFKGGVEGSTFSNLPRVTIRTKIDELLKCLEDSVKMIEKRLEVLRINRCKNLGELLSKEFSSLKWTDEIKNEEFLYRQLIIIDEAATVFMANALVSPKQSTQAKSLAAHLAAQGRAVGIHLVISTQRPEVKAVDPLIKANLMGRLCFYMSDNASSMTILDSARAADLPQSPKGRAIWRSGPVLTEVQVPEVDDDRVQSLLAPFRSDEAEKDNAEQIKADLKNIEENSKALNGPTTVGGTI